MLGVADVAYRLLCARRALSRWVEDRALEKEEFRVMWEPFKGLVIHLILVLCLNMTCLYRLDWFMFWTHDAVQDVFTNNHFPDDGPVQQMIVYNEVDTVEVGEPLGQQGRQGRFRLLSVDCHCCPAPVELHGLHRGHRGGL